MKLDVAQSRMYLANRFRHAINANRQIEVSLSWRPPATKEIFRHMRYIFTRESAVITGNRDTWHFQFRDTRCVPKFARRRGNKRLQPDLSIGIACYDNIFKRGEQTLMERNLWKTGITAKRYI